MNRKFIVLCIKLILLSLLVLAINPTLVKAAYQKSEEYPRGCSYLRCAKGDQCVNRKFWCKNPPCPSMLYCSKSRKESLKGPSTCESVRCSKGYMCLVRARNCRWDQSYCRQQIARCVSEREYYEGATSCVDFRCPDGHQCILRESLCARPPCKLLKSCAKFKDVQTWFDVCKNLGCPSEHECFLRKPFEKCSSSPCKHTPDCTNTDDTDNDGSGNQHCRGWVCPRTQKCSAHIKEPCKLETCKIIRSCHGPLILPENQPANSGTSSWKPAKYQPVTVIPTPPSSARNAEPKNRKALTKFEREYIFRDRNKGKQSLSSTSSTIGATMNKPRMRYTNLRNNLQQRDNFGISRGSKQLNDVISTLSTSTAMGINREIPVYNEPISVTTTMKPTSTIAMTSSPKSSSSGIFQNPGPTLSSLSAWLNHLKLKTGIDAIEQWVKNAQSRKDYPQFEEWLKSVKELLGPPIFETWLEEVRSLTQENSEFQEWLPKPSRYQILDSHHFYDTDSRIADMENEGLTVFPRLGRFEGRSNENLIRKSNEIERSSSSVFDYNNFSSKRKEESERFLSNFPENVVRHNQKFHTAFRDAHMSTTTTTTNETPKNSALWTEDEVPSHRIIENNSLSQVSSENSVIYPQKLPIVTTTPSWQNTDDELKMNFEKFDSKFSDEFYPGQNSYFEKPTDGPKDLSQPYRGVVRHQQEPEVEQNLTNVPQSLSNLYYPYLTINQNLSNDPYRSFENLINVPYVQTPIVNGFDYYSNPTRNLDSPGTIVYNVYRNDIQQIPPFTESFQISEYPFSRMSSVYPQDMVRNDFPNFWPARQLPSYLPRARTKHSNGPWTISKYSDLNDINMAAKSKLPYNEYTYDFGYYRGPGNNFKPENNEYFINPRLIQEQMIRNSRNLVAPKFISFPYKSPFNTQNPIASRYMSLLGYVPQIPVDEKEQALSTYSLSSNPLEMNPFERYSRPSLSYEEMKNPKNIKPYDAFLDKEILDNTEISTEDTQKMGLRVLPEKYQGSLKEEEEDLKRNHRLGTREESKYRIPDEIITESKPKISDVHLSWKFPKRQSVTQERKTVVTSFPKSYKDIKENRMSDVDRYNFFDQDQYVHRNDRELRKRMESRLTEEAKTANEYLSEIESSTIPNNIFQPQPSDYSTDEYSETFEDTPRDRHVDILAEIPKNIVTTFSTDESVDDDTLEKMKNYKNEDSSTYEMANENYKNYIENFNFYKNTNYKDDPTSRYSPSLNNSNHIFHMRSNLEFLKNHINGNNNTIHSEGGTVAKRREKNIFKDERYGGYSDFPNNLRTVYNVENDVELKTLFESDVAPRSSNVNATSEKNNNNYEDEESTVDYSEMDKDNRLSRYTPKSSGSVLKNQNFQKDDIDYTREHYDEAEYDFPDEENQRDERYDEKQSEE